MTEVFWNSSLGKKVHVKCNTNDTMGTLIAAQIGTHWNKITLKKRHTIFKHHISLGTMKSMTGWTWSFITDRAEFLPPAQPSPPFSPHPPPQYGCLFLKSHDKKKFRSRNKKVHTSLQYYWFKVLHIDQPTLFESSSGILAKPQNISCRNNKLGKKEILERHR